MNKNCSYITEIANLNTIGEINKEAVLRSHNKWNALAKPLGSLGRLETIIEQMSGITGDENLTLSKPLLYIICADNGVIEEGVSQSSYDVTAAVARSLADGDSTVCNLSKGTGTKVVPVDVGIKDFDGYEGVLNYKLMNGTDNMTKGPAIPIKKVVEAINIGIELTKTAADKGYDVLMTGEMGIGNTTTSSALAAILLNMDVSKVTGRGAGLSDEGLNRKVDAIERAITTNKPDVNDPIDMLSKVGGLDIACITGLFIGGAIYRIPVIMDGFITMVAACLAVQIEPKVSDYFFASHMSQEPACRALMDKLGKKAIVDADMHLGEGSGAVAALTLLQMAINVYNSGHSFGDIGIEAYKPQ